jgi:hypothetical protein
MKASVLTLVLKLVLLSQCTGDSGSNPGHGIARLRCFPSYAPEILGEPNDYFPATVGNRSCVT